MAELVWRYSQPPYNIRYWEIGNEPDVSLADLNGDATQPFGCWGLEGDPYYGGKQYGDVLARIYPYIKGANPNAQVLIGGLLLNCDHASPTSGGCPPSRFLQGILQAANGPNSFDMVSFHAYTYWGTGDLDWDMSHPAWSHRPGRGLVLGKVDFIRETLAAAGVNKPIILTEGGLLCHPSAPCPETPFRDDQANYAVRLYSRSWAAGLSGALWYTINGPGWREGGLLDNNQAPRPAFVATKFLAQTLEGATFVGAVPIASGEGYLFSKGGSTYHVYWSNLRSVAYDIPMPAGTVAVYNKYGQSIPSPNGVVNISFQPVIIRTTP